MVSFSFGLFSEYPIQCFCCAREFPFRSTRARVSVCVCVTWIDLRLFSFQSFLLLFVLFVDQIFGLTENEVE